ncbi:MAG TPA: hypothetical protein ENJ95_17165 [Bacteroidetes bacterium]|nr:hypothetical protein [Bacteroidota bacterium]
MRPSILSSFLAVFILAISLTSCFSPQKIVQVESAGNETTKWNYGRQVVLVKKGDYEAHIFFEDFTKKDLIFDVEVVNLAEKETLLQPEVIQLVANTGRKAWAYDPEKEIFGGQMERSRKEAANKNTALAVGAVVVAATVAAIASDDDGGGGRSDDGIVLDGLDAAATISYAYYAVPPPPMQYLPPTIDFWKDYSLRKTTLDKGYQVSGKVVFPRMDEARELTVVVPVGDVELKATFKQRLIQP